MKYLKFIALVAFIGFFSACSEEEVTPDYIGESVGTYSYSARVFDSNNTVVETITGDLTLSRNGDDITISIDGDETIKTSRVEVAGNGYGFDIEASTIEDFEGDLVNRTGDAAASLDGKTYHGRYDTGAKQLYVNVSYIYQDTQYSDYNYSFEVIATKE